MDHIKLGVTETASHDVINSNADKRRAVCVIVLTGENKLKF